jgi:hypothetical protein
MLHKKMPGATRMVTDIRAHWGYPPKQEQVLEDILSRNEINGDWDYAVHIHEGSEQYLGSQQFDSLLKRFASVPGVDACMQEDREVFLVKTKTLDTENLRKSFMAKVS